MSTEGFLCAFVVYICLLKELSSGPKGAVIIDLGGKMRRRNSNQSHLKRLENVY